MDAVKIRRFRPVPRRYSMPSGAANTQMTVMGPVGLRSINNSHAWASDPPVASMGSSTMQVRPANVSGSLLT